MLIPTTASGPRGARWLDALAGDLRFAFRYFARHKATTAIIVAVITLGTGANTVIFSIFQAQFLRPAPAVPDNRAHARIVVQERPTRTARWQARHFAQPEIPPLAAPQCRSTTRRRESARRRRATE